MGGDRSINSFYSRRLLTILLCYKNEKVKENKIQKVIGEETMKRRCKNKIRSGFENKKKMKQR